MFEGCGARSTVLGDREVHVWSVPLSRGPGQAVLDTALSAAELAAMARFASARERRRYGLAHAALRSILAGYARVDPVDLRFARERYGKPRVAGGALHFSLAHGGDLALVAVGHRPVGVDVEPLRPLPVAAELARSCFTARERAQLDDAGGGHELLRMWARKEATVKATGEGLNRPLAGFEVLGESPLPGWRIVDLAPAPGYVGAVVVRQDVTDVTAMSSRGVGAARTGRELMARRERRATRAS